MIISADAQIWCEPAEDQKLHSHLAEWPTGLKLFRTEKDTEYYGSQELHILSAVIDKKLYSMI